MEDSEEDNIIDEWDNLTDDKLWNILDNLNTEKVEEKEVIMNYHVLNVNLMISF
jgi:hypothetical protein